MNFVELSEKINAGYVEVCESGFLKVLSQIQKDHQKEYKKKLEDNGEIFDIHTKITCIICGGNYTAKSRFLHNKTIKHITSVNNIIDYIDSKK